MHNSCSNVSHKFLRRSPGRRAGNHQRAISSGSYDLTGPGVEPRLEIGHPILINKTAIDVDSIDLRTATTTEVDSVIHETETESSDSEVSHVPHLQDITFSFLPQHEGFIEQSTDYEIPPNPKRVSPIETTLNANTKTKSKSSANLHKSELTVYLRRCSSVRLIKHQVATIDIPLENKKNHVFGRKSLPPEFPPPPPPPIFSATEKQQKEIPENTYETAGSLRRRASYSKAVKDTESGEETSSTNPQEPADEIQEMLESMKKETDLHPGKSLTHIFSDSRVNLLRGKNLKMPQFNRTKAKNAWSGFRHWLGEEVARVRPHGEENIPTKDDEGAMGNHGEEIVMENPSTGPDSSHEGQSGFEELRRYVKQGDDFSKEMLAILQERAEAELTYAKSLSKMAIKLNKACREVPANTANSWRNVAAEMEARGEIHRQFSSSMAEEIVKPLKVIMENQYKARKAVEGTVDKSARILSDWRSSEAKAKSKCASAAKKNEKLQDTGLDVRIQRSPSLGILHHGNGLPLPTRNPEKEERLTEKEKAKLETKRRKAEEAVKRADVEYYTSCVRAERARVEYEKAIGRGSTVLQTLDNQRQIHMRTYIENFLKLIPYAAEFSLESDLGGSDETPVVMDIKNDALIKHFIRPSLGRSKSVVEYGSRSETLPSSGISINGQANGSIGGRESPIWDRGIADGGSNQHDSDFDEFSSHDEEEDCTRKSDKCPPTPQVTESKAIGRCKAIYNYTPKLYDELELNPGDIIEIHVKQEDGWWLGALRDRVGIFPATYVEEIP
uniref:Putative e3 ubiquitin-protein ligase bre1 isoform x1 n=1 Tax=Lutzomyia longipalpis TaxID=7200 RepID=A0A7G3AV94_LUTLO